MLVAHQESVRSGADAAVHQLDVAGHAVQQEGHGQHHSHGVGERSTVYRALEMTVPLEVMDWNSAIMLAR